MYELLILAGLLLGLGLIASYWRNARIGELARVRMEHGVEVSAGSHAEEVPVARSYLVRHRYLPWVLGLSVAGLLYFVMGWALPFVIAVGLIVGLQAGQLEAYLAAGRTAKIETQLADAIDLMVAALSAGASVADALENAMAESRSPLRPQLEEVVGRIRLGDDARMAYRGLTQRVPLETFLLFS